MASEGDGDSHGGSHGESRSESQSSHGEPGGSHGEPGDSHGESHGGIDPSPLTWIGSDRRLARRVGRPLLRFIHLEAAGGMVMLAATVVALAWANSPWHASYDELLHTYIDIEIGDLHALHNSVGHWINDALMAVFFFLMGLEIKRELVAGELRQPRAAALPAIAALGGMVVPALIYVTFNAGGAGIDGWGIPMATDIAFAVGVVSLLGNRVPGALRVFLLTLAIVDDIGAIVVIAVFYTDDLSMEWLGVAAASVAVLVLMRSARVWYPPLYAFVGVVLWLATYESGVHATIAGVVLGLLAPARPLMGRVSLSDSVVGRLFTGPVSASAARRATFEVREQVSVADRLTEMLHPWTSFFIVPVFALANAGVVVSWDSLRDALRSPVTLGVVMGLIVGKMLGVSLFSWVAVRLGWCELPRGANWSAVVGIAAVAGIGFTVSLFVTGLAFDDLGLESEAKMGILVASTIAAIIGTAILRRSTPAAGPSSVRTG